MEMLAKLNKVNESHEIIAHSKFYVPDLKECVDIKEDYIRWVQQKLQEPHRQGRHFYNYPFLFDGEAKSVLLQTDAALQMLSAQEEANMSNVIGLMFAVHTPLQPFNPINPCLILNVRRDNLVQDTLTQLQGKNPRDFKRPLKVKFEGEDGIDEGGVRKELFRLLLCEVMDPTFDMFTTIDGSNFQWFNSSTSKDLNMFRMIGTLCGLAIYNFTIIDLHFPLALFKKLLKKPVLLDDLIELMPDIGSCCDINIGKKIRKLNLTGVAGLVFSRKNKNPATFAGKVVSELICVDLWSSDVDCIFKNNFWIDVGDRTLQLKHSKWIEGHIYTRLLPTRLKEGITDIQFGETKFVELCPGGKDKEVNNENKHEYVDLYVDYLLNKSVYEQFTAFSEGFLAVCGGHVLDCFHPLELQAIVVGNEDYDFEELEKNTTYKGDYCRYHQTINFFWEVFHEMSLVDKKKFLLFLTGSDRIPIYGMKHLKIIIQPSSGGEDSLPVALTCFSVLNLPRYTTKENMQQKLLVAIQHTVGFGLN
ncbi:HECT and RLD domain containing E3 ubiquitin protein ligase 4 [Elysia marginata]|uniref:HECT-type E3 ubiquitin transferase n=1 Tax=Elysia marginata TaxID=1093978 RepID=A0AAV4JNX8_9GAST|nr:HECT and RLD domain containing E3 ubiquitin protein ligase 4 [Elysia marginata]